MEHPGVSVTSAHRNVLHAQLPGHVGKSTCMLKSPGGNPQLKESGVTAMLLPYRLCIAG